MGDAVKQWTKQTWELAKTPKGNGGYLNLDAFADMIKGKQKAKVGGGSSLTPNIADKLIDGSSMKTSEALEAGSDFLGEGYIEPNPGSGRFVSADGTHVFRMGENDILGKHGGGPHVNFEILEPNPTKPGKMQMIKNIHIYLED